MKKIMIVIAIILFIAIMISMIMSLPKINNQFESCVSGYYVSSIDFEDSEIQCRLDETFNQSLGNDTYLLLDASNGPLTGDLQISANVGIGTDNLTVPLEINSKGNGSVIINTDTNSNFTYLYLTEGLHQAYTGYTKYGIYLKYNGDTNNFAIGNVQADVETDNFYIDRDTGNIGFGTASSPNKPLHASWVSTDTAVTTGNALGGGGVGKGALIANTAGTVNSYANLDLRTSSADGRIAYQNKGVNNGDFHFITDNGGVFPIVFTIENEGAIRQPSDTKYYQGISSDVSIHFNSTDWVFNPREVGTGDGYLLNDWHITGDLDVTRNFTGNQIYGEMWYHNHTATPLNFAVDGVFYSLYFDNAINLNGFSFDGSENLTAQVSGKYKVNYMASGDGQNNHVYFTSIFVNNINQDRCESHKKMTAGGDIITMTGD